MERAILIRLLLLAIVATGCVRGDTGYRCVTDTQCDGTCEANGFCSFSDSSCASGRRFGTHAGGFANECVDAATDAGVDMPVDMPLPVAPQVVASAVSNAGAVASLSYALGIPASSDRYLIVSVHLGSGCGVGVPDVMSVTYNAVPLTKLNSITGSSCSATDTTRSDQWELIAPPTGNHNVIVTLDMATPFTIHSGAIAIAGVDQTTPVRATMAALSNGTSSFVMVASADGDLVVDTIGTGGQFTGADPTQTVLFQNNASGGNTLNNSAASTLPGTAAGVAFVWNGNNDIWQDIATSIRPL